MIQTNKPTETDVTGVVKCDKHIGEQLFDIYGDTRRIPVKHSFPQHYIEVIFFIKANKVYMTFYSIGQKQTFFSQNTIIKLFCGKSSASPHIKKKRQDNVCVMQLYFSNEKLNIGEGSATKTYQRLRVFLVEYMFMYMCEYGIK